MPIELDQHDHTAATATLMLYVSGELEPAEREAFERRLAAEPALAAEVEQARGAHDAVAAQLARADAHGRLPVNEAVAVRRVSRAISTWQVNRNAAPAAAVKPAWRLPWWAYPTAAAASLIVGFLVWSSRQEIRSLAPSPDAQRGISMLEQEQSELAEWIATSLEPTADASLDRDTEQLLSASGADDLSWVYQLPRPAEENAQ